MPDTPRRTLARIIHGLFVTRETIGAKSENLRNEAESKHVYVYVDVCMNNPG